MRKLHALIIASGLCVPSLALAAAPVDHGQRTSTAHVVAQNQQANQQVAQSDRPTAAQADRARYADKEAKSGEAQDYRGGDTVVIGASAATAVLAVLLLIVLL